MHSCKSKILMLKLVKVDLIFTCMTATNDYFLLIIFSTNQLIVWRVNIQKSVINAAAVFKSDTFTMLVLSN